MNERLKVIKKLNEDFGQGVLECAKNLAVRSIKDKLSLKDLEPINYEVDRIDYNLFRKNGDFLFYLDIENPQHQSTLKDMIRESYKISKKINDELPGKFTWKFSGRGFHGCCLIKDKGKVFDFLLKHQMRIYDFCKSIAYGISLKLEINFDYFDTSQFNKNGMIRGFCRNSKAELNGIPMYCVPVDLDKDSINDIVNKSLLRKEFDSEFVVPEFDLLEFYKKLPVNYGRGVSKGLIRLDMKYASVPLELDLDPLPYCILYLMGKQNISNRQRFLLIAFFKNYMQFPAIKVLQIFKQHLSEETFNKIKLEGQIESIFNSNVVTKECNLIHSEKHYNGSCLIQKTKSFI